MKYVFFQILFSLLFFFFIQKKGREHREHRQYANVDDRDDLEVI